MDHSSSPGVFAATIALLSIACINAFFARRMWTPNRLVTLKTRLSGFIFFCLAVLIHLAFAVRLMFFRDLPIAAFIYNWYILAVVMTQAVLGWMFIAIGYIEAGDPEDDGSIPPRKHENLGDDSKSISENE